MHPITEIWNEKARWFRDQAQGSRVASILLERLADDRVQEECRYLSRLRWHFFMGYQEVSYQQLLEHVSAPKLTVLNELFSAIADRNYDEIDAWANRCESVLPIIHDRWHDQFGASPDVDESVE
jgi:hypothetical protein